MYNILTNLVNKKFYADRETAIAKIDVCFAMGKITTAQLSALMLLLVEKYSE